MCHPPATEMQSAENFKLFSVLPRAAQSISQHPLISCHFPKPNIKFPL